MTFTTIQMGENGWLKKGHEYSTVSKEREKSSFWKIKESLVGRVLLIVFILLMIPFFLLTLFHYYEDLKAEKKTERLELNFVADETQKQVDQTIAQKQNILNDADFLLSSHEESSAAFSLIKTQLQALALIHVQADSQGRYICDQDFENQLVGRDYSVLVQRSLAGETFGYSQQLDQFFLLSKGEGGKSFWMAFFKAPSLIKKWGLFASSTREIIVLVVDEEKEVVATTQANFYKKKVGVKEKKGEGMTLTLEKEVFIAEKRSLVGSDVTLLILLSAEVDFADIPHFFRKLAMGAFLVTLFGGVGTVVMSYYLSRPFKELCSVMQQVSFGNLKLRFKARALGFEINALGGIFNDVIRALIVRMEQVRHEKVGKELLAKELRIGQEVQHAIIPKELPKVPLLDIGAHFISAQEVGGDFYDFLKRESEGQEQLLFTVADTAGKGIYACLYSLTIRSILRSYGLMCHRLEELLEKANDLFCKDSGDSGVFVTMWAAIFDQKTKKLTFSNCGHHQAFLKKEDGSVHSLSTKGMALGAVSGSDMVIETKTIQLAENDRLLIFTDGIIEALNDQLEMFGQERLVRAFENQGEESAQESVEALIDEVFKFTGGAPQHDDLTLVYIVVKPAIVT